MQELVTGQKVMTENMKEVKNKGSIKVNDFEGSEFMRMLGESR